MLQRGAAWGAEVRRASPYGSVVVDGNGNVFGTAAVGGSQNQGIVFEITP